MGRHLRRRFRPAYSQYGFPVEGRREASFVELAAKIGTKYRFLQAKLPNSAPGRQVSGTAYMRHWIDEIQGRPIAAVLGHRVGSVYAAALADVISQWQQAPQVILFGIGGTYCRKCFAPFETYMSLVSTARQIDPSQVWKRSTAIVSFDYRDGSLPAGDSCGMIGHSISFDVPHTDLLRSDSVAKKVLELLEF